MSAPGGVTDVLLNWGQGDLRARDELLPLIYDELRQIARAYLRQERPDHTLQPTELVHEAYLRLIDQRRVNWQNRAQFIGLAAVMMRRVLVNHARNRKVAKRGGTAQRVPLTIAVDFSDQPDHDVIAVHDALSRLHAIDERKGRIVELKFFGGLTTDEIAEVMNLSSATIEREWSFARAWLYDVMTADSQGSAS